MSARFILSVMILATLSRTAPLHAQEDPGKMRQVVYPVADLVVPIEMDNSKPQRSSSTIEDTLIQLVCRTCAPMNTWADVGGPGSIKYMPKEMSLIVNQTVSCHERIRELFAELRNVQDVEISIDTRYLTLSAARAKLLEAIGDRAKIGKFLPADGPDAVCLSDREMLLLLTFAQEDRDSSVMAAPKITLFNGQKAVLSIADYLRVNEGDIDQDGKAITSPKIEIGIRNVLQPVVELEDGSVRLALECSETRQREKAPRGRVFATQTIKHVVRVPQSQTVALKLGADPKGRQQYVLLTPRVIRQSEQELGKQTTAARVSQPKRSRQERSLRVFPIADLLAPIVANPPADASKSALAKRTAAPRAAEAMTPPALVQLITTSVAPSTWEGKGGEGSIHYYPLGQALVVFSRDNVHDEVNNLLAARRRLHDLRVSFDCRVVELTEAAYERIAQGKSQVAATRSVPREAASEEQSRTGPGSFTLPSAAPTRSVEMPRHVPQFVAPTIPTAAPTVSAAKSLLPISKAGLTLLKPSEAHELRRLLAEEQPALAEQVLGAVTFNGCPVRIDKTKPYTYTTDVNVTLEDGVVVVKPVTRTLRVGTVIEALPIVKTDREGLFLEIAVDHALLAGASMQTIRVGPLGEETECVLQRPTVNTIRSKTVVDLTKSGTLVLPLGIMMTEARNEFGPPVLSKIPYVNRLFRNVGYGRESRFLYVMITPQIHGR